MHISGDGWFICVQTAEMIRQSHDDDDYDGDDNDDEDDDATVDDGDAAVDAFPEADRSSAG